MGCRMGESPSEQLPIPTPPPSNDEAAFLYSIFCLIGLPVDVRVRNGSVFSGIFHTASVEGVVLKKARLTKKGKSDTNVAVGCTVETLVIFSGDLVEVVSKGEVVPASGIGGNCDSDEFGSIWGTIAASHTDAKAGKKSKGFTISKKNPFHKSASAIQTDDRLVNRINDVTTKLIKKTAYNIQEEEKKLYPNAVGTIFPEEMKTDQMILDQEPSSIPQFERNVHDGKVQRENVSCCGESNTDRTDAAHAIASSSASNDSHLVNVKPVKGTNSAGQPQPHGGNHDTSASGINSDKGTCHRPISSDGATNSTKSALSAAPSVDTSFDPCHSSTASPVDKVHFQPLQANKIAKGSKLNPGAKIFSPSYAPTLATSPPLAQDAGGISYIPGSSPLFPVATVQADVGMGTFLPQNALANKMVRNIASRTPLLRYGVQQQAMQTGSPYVNPSSQAVMVGRLGQLVYMPVSQDLVHSAAAVSPVFAHPLPAVNQMQLPKHQGTVAHQAFAHPTVVAGQLYAAPNPTILQSQFLAGHPVAVPGSNGFYNAKFS